MTCNAFIIKTAMRSIHQLMLFYALLSSEFTSAVSVFKTKCKWIYRVYFDGAESAWDKITLYSLSGLVKKDCVLFQRLSCFVWLFFVYWLAFLTQLVVQSRDALKILESLVTMELHCQTGGKIYVDMNWIVVFTRLSPNIWPAYLHVGKLRTLCLTDTDWLTDCSAKIQTVRSHCRLSIASVLQLGDRFRYGEQERNVVCVSHHLHWRRNK